jgi:signal transduction histidine kinase
VPPLVTVWSVLWWSAAVTVGLLLRARNAQRERARATIRQQVRLEMARELHDVLAHHITGMLVQAQAGSLVADQDPAAARSALVAIEDTGAEAMRSIRDLVAYLRDGAETVPVTRFALDPLVEPCRGQGIQVDTEVTGDVDELTTEVATTLHRLVQESVTNVLKHGHDVHKVVVEVLVAEKVSLRVLDDGIAHGHGLFPMPAGFGLIGMRERVEARGGTLTAGPLPGRGWEVRATLPRTGSRA